MSNCSPPLTILDLEAVGRILRTGFGGLFTFISNGVID